MLAAAAAHLDALVIGVDADAAAMVEASRRAGRPAGRGGLPNALFAVAAAEALPAELDGLIDSLTVQFPWGSLLRGVLRPESAILAGLARVTRPGATVTLLVSVTGRDSAGIEPLDAGAIERLACPYAEHGLRLVEGRPATAADLARSHSTWGKRLRAGGERPAWLIRFERSPSIRCAESAGRRVVDPYPGGAHTPAEAGE